MLLNKETKLIIPNFSLAQSAGAVEYTDCISAEGLDPNQRVSGYDTKKFNGEVPVMLELWEMLSTPSLPLLPGPFWFGEVASDRVLSNRTKLRTYAKLNCLK